jgi:hypothetical protein
MPQHSPEVTEKVYELLNVGNSQGQVSKLTGVPQPTISRWVKAQRFHSEPSAPTGEPDTGPQPAATVHSSEPSGEPRTAMQCVELMGEPGEPDIARQTDLDNVKARVEALEVFIARLDQPATYLPGSPSAPTHKRGFVMADDLFEAIHTYTRAHHLQVKGVLDLALRRFFAQVGQEVGADA